MMTALPSDLPAFTAAASSWLASQAPRRVPLVERRWGEGSDDVAVFRDLPEAEERRVLGAALDWQRAKADAGYGSLAWPVDVTLVAILRDKHVMAPSPDDPLEVGDELLFVSAPDQEEALRALLAGDPASGAPSPLDSGGGTEQ